MEMRDGHFLYLFFYIFHFIFLMVKIEALQADLSQLLVLSQALKNAAAYNPLLQLDLPCLMALAAESSQTFESSLRNQGRHHTAVLYSCVYRLCVQASNPCDE